MTQKKTRCAWSQKSELMTRYHDHVWGVPCHDDHDLFEKICLDGAQAGLSWSTILNKQENYRKAFDNFNVKKMRKYDEQKIAELMLESGIVRNRLKINAFITNAKVLEPLIKEMGSFDDYLWSFVNHKTIQNHWEHLKQVPATTPISDALSKDLKKRGFKFVGSTIVYAFMQAIGMVNDHTTDCFRHRELQK